MSKTRRDRITVVPLTPLPISPPALEDAPSDGQSYVRIDGQWSLMPQVVSSWQSGTAYYDGTTALYVVYGADGNWQATKATTSNTLSTAASQTGTKPATLAALQGLSYS